MTLLLLRHGESEGNVLGVIQGWREYALTERGRAQARAAAERLAALDVVALYASPLARAAETAAIVASRVGVPVHADPALREYHFGAAEGLRWAEAQARWQLPDRAWGSGLVPGEESTGPFRTRVFQRLTVLAETHVLDVAVAVVHGGVLGALVASLMGLGVDQHVRMHAGNAGLTTLEQRGDRLEIVALNDCCHLEPGAATATPRWQAAGG